MSLYNSTNIINKKEQAYLRLLNLVDAKKAHYLLNNVPMEKLYNCMQVYSNACIFNGKHRDKYLNILDAILCANISNWYVSVTYGTQPNTTCYDYIGRYTDCKYNNAVIANYLMIIKENDLKKWLLNNHKFNDQEKRILHYFKRGVKQ